MQLNLNKEQLEKLLKYAFVGFNVITTNKESLDQLIEDDENFITELYKQAHNSGCELIEQFNNIYGPTGDFVEELLDELEEYEEDSTYQNLAEWLSLRDITEDYTEEELDNMSEKEFLNLLEEFEDAYGEEFGENGVENLYLTEPDETK